MRGLVLRSSGGIAQSSSFDRLRMRTPVLVPQERTDPLMLSLSKHEDRLALPARRGKPSQ